MEYKRFRSEMFTPPFLEKCLEIFKCCLALNYVFNFIYLAIFNIMRNAAYIYNHEPEDKKNLNVCFEVMEILWSLLIVSVLINR